MRLHSAYIHKAYVGDKSIFRARYPLRYTFTFVCIYSMRLRCLRVNVKRKRIHKYSFNALSVFV